MSIVLLSESSLAAEKKRGGHPRFEAADKLAGVYTGAL
jgi:hypothetical protein